jgi:serine/threonine protein kinase/WD40 repeat protein
MALSPGTRLGGYEIVAPVGAGGMGEVYRAREATLDRHVAIKVLPPRLADDAMALARFEREAKAVAALSHPNILSIFAFGRDGPTAFAVTELLEGETLRQKLAASIPIRKAVDYGVQIARGLAAAHAKGIVHRDLKPENVFVTGDGRVKILDFGLARQNAALASVDTTVSPGVERHTDPGTVLGTVGYMSPEQARGDAGDARSDLFSLGALLYELVSGRRAFQRDTAAETLTAILREDPPGITEVSKAEVPPGLARVVEHCLEKNPSERFQSASDVAFALESLSTASASGAHAVTSGPARRFNWLPWGVAAAFALIASALALVAYRAPTTAPPSLTRLSMQLPKDLPYGRPPSPGRSLAISPDGRAIVYVSGPTRRRQLYRRVLDRTTIEPIAGTEGAYQPFFSPDGHWLAFFTFAGELKKVSPDGGTPVTLARGLPNGQWGFGVWRPDDTIVFSTMENLRQVPAAGGMPTALTTVDRNAHESFHHYPMLVPATGDVLFTVYDDDGNQHLDAYRWATHQRVKVLSDLKGPVFAPSGHILFTQNDTLMAAPYDATRRSAGPAVPLGESVVLDNVLFSTPQLAVAPTGTMTYVPTNPDEPSAMAGWVDRAGQFEEVSALPKGTSGFSLSPDGKTAAIQSGARLSLLDLDRRVVTRVETPKRSVESVTWHPDGHRLTLGGPYLSLFDPDTGKETRLTESGRPKRSASWSPDGRTVAYMTFNPSNAIHVLSLDGGAPRALVATSALESDPMISPDGRWMAFMVTAGDAAGRRDVYVVRFPEGTSRVQITNDGGGTPFWSRDSRELFFTAPPGVLKVVSISGTERLEVGQAKTLFALNDLNVEGLSSDGRRFFGVRVPRADPPREIVVVQNWLQELTRLVPAAK